MATIYVNTDYFEAIHDGSSRYPWTKLAAAIRSLPATLTESVEIICSGATNDTEQVIIPVITMGAFTLTIKTSDTARHQGFWDDANFTLQPDVNGSALTINSTNVIIDGLQIDLDRVDSTGITMSHPQTGICTARNNIIRGTNTNHRGIQTSNPSGDHFIYNNIIYGSLYTGILTSYISGNTNTYYVANNTVHNTFATGNSCFSLNGVATTTHTVVNNIAQGTITGSHYLGSDYDTKTNNISEDGTGEIDPVTLTFENAAGGDYRLAVGDVSAIDAGVSQSGTFTIDSTGGTRSGTWDIGANERGVTLPTASPTGDGTSSSVLFSEYTLTITSNPPSVTRGQTGVTLGATNGGFGASQGTSTLEYGNDTVGWIAIPVTIWSDTLITFDIPNNLMLQHDDVTGYKFKVTVNTTLVSTTVAIPLTTAGRVGFYVDYSELSTAGTHRFYVTRTHGSAGAITVDYLTSGDTHTVASGTISFADGELGVKEFIVNIPTKANAGDHRITATLSNPTGGAVLHNGANTVAYGVIDDGTIALDADAVFYDSAAAGGGDGSQATPYNSIYTAITNVGSKKYIYGKGTTTPDSNYVDPNGGTGFVYSIQLPAARAGESTRLSIRNWPGFTWTIDGGVNTDRIGFISKSSASYMTFRGIDFSNLDASGSAFAEGGGISNFTVDSVRQTVEYCTFDNINGSTNTSAYNAYFTIASKMWRSTANNIQVNGSAANQNAGGLCLYFYASDLSIQRCEASNAYVGLFPKYIESGDTMPTVRFNYFHNMQSGITVGFASADGYSDYFNVQSNLFKDISGSPDGVFWARGAAAAANGKHQISNNVFDNCDTGGGSAILTIRDSYDWQFFNNITANSAANQMLNYDTVPNQSDPARDVIEYWDYNQVYLSGEVYTHLAQGYANAGLLNAFDATLAGNIATTDPLFTNSAINDYTLQVGSPCIGTGVNTSDKGIYLTGIEVVGA